MVSLFRPHEVFGKSMGFTGLEIPTAATVQYLDWFKEGKVQEIRGKWRELEFIIPGNHKGQRYKMLRFLLRVFGLYFKGISVEYMNICILQPQNIPK